MKKIEGIYETYLESKNYTGKSREEFLKKQEDNQDYLEFLKLMLDKDATFGLGRAKLKKVADTPANPNITYDEVIAHLLKNNTGKIQDAELVMSFINNAETEEFKNFLIEIFVKTVRLGMTDKTINKVFPNLIKTWEVQRSSNLNKHWHLLDNNDVTIYEKLEDVRAIITHQPNEFSIKSREGKEFYGDFADVRAEIERLDYGIYDGGLIIQDREGMIHSEVLRKTIAIVMNKKDKIKKGVEFIWFNYLTLDEFNAGVSKLNHRMHQVYMDSVLEQEFLMAEPLNYVKRPPVLYQGRATKEIALQCFEKVQEHKGEGIFINLLDYPYYCKRTATTLKYKSENTVDLRCVDIYESELNPNTLAGIVLEYKGNTTNCGIGFSEEISKKIWEDPSYIIGKIVEVKYTEESEDKTGKKALRHASFLRIREDKNEVSYE